MNFTYNGNKPENVNYNGNALDYVKYNGDVVWKRIKPSIIKSCWFNTSDDNGRPTGFDSEYSPFVTGLYNANKYSGSVIRLSTANIKNNPINVSLIVSPYDDNPNVQPRTDYVFCKVFQNPVNFDTITAAQVLGSYPSLPYYDIGNITYDLDREVSIKIDNSFVVTMLQDRDYIDVSLFNVYRSSSVKFNTNPNDENCTRLGVV